MVDLCITESFQVKRQMLLSASEAAEMILRVDNIIKAAPRSVQSFSDHLRLFVPGYRNLLFISVLQEESSRPSPLLEEEEDEKKQTGITLVIYHFCVVQITSNCQIFFSVELADANHQTQLTSVALLMLAYAVQFQHKVKMRSLHTVLFFMLTLAELLAEAGWCQLRLGKKFERCFVY